MFTFYLIGFLICIISLLLMYYLLGDIKSITFSDILFIFGISALSWATILGIIVGLIFVLILGINK